MGNGGSAAVSQHLAVEAVGRLTRKRPGLASIAVTADSSILTAIGNGDVHGAVFGCQVEGTGPKATRFRPGSCLRPR